MVGENKRKAHHETGKKGKEESAEGQEGVKEEKRKKERKRKERPRTAPQTWIDILARLDQEKNKRAPNVLLDAGHGLVCITRP